MKRMIQSLAMILALASMMTVLMGCNVNLVFGNPTTIASKDDAGNSNIPTVNLNSPSVSTNTFHNMTDLDMFQVYPSKQSIVISDQFSDGINNYFYYHIGQIDNVPIYYSDIQSHKAENQTISISSAYSISSMLQKTTNICVEQAISNTLEKAHGISGTVGKENEASATLSYESSKSSTNSLTNSVGKEFTESLTSSITNSSSNELTLSSADKEGEYRYIQLATFDVYAVLVCNLENKTCHYDYLTSVKKDSISSGWYYGLSRSDMMIPEKLDSSVEKISFDTTVLAQTDLYTPVSEKRLVRRIRAYSNEDYYVSYWKGTTYNIWMNDCSLIYHSEAVKGLGLDNVRITVNYTVESRDGESKCVAKLYSATETLLNKSKNVDGTKKLTMEITMTHDRFLQAFLTDKKVYTSFEADKSSYFDLVDNHYHITSWELIVELY